ncbi:MAG: binding-protein-dependent transport system inner rane component [Actinomycetia bacterium]|nr:binding-protein-dependent transport system inner rane component [Actinomycetes bacterium]
MTALDVKNEARPRTVPVAPAAAKPPAKRRRPTRLLLDALPPLAVAGVVVAGWYAATYLLLTPQRRFLLPPPHAVVQKGLFDAQARGEIFHAVLSTARVAAFGLVIASLLGITLAIAMSQARWVQRSLYPWAILLQTVPILAIVPLIGFWWGFDFRSRVLVCVLISLFPMITNTLFGLQSVPSGLHDVFSIRRVSRVSRLVHLELPAALPSIFTGLRISAGLSVIGAIVGDFFFRQGDPGIGRLIDNYRAQLASEQLFAAIFASSLLGLLAFLLVGAIGNRTVGRWHDSGRRRP